MNRFLNFFGMAKNDYPERMKKINMMQEDERNASLVTKREKLIKDYNLSPKIIKVSRPATGLENLGNTCFMNSVLQCLAHTTVVRAYFFNFEWTQTLNPLTSQSGGVLACEFYNYFYDYWTVNNDWINPKNIKRAFAKVNRAFVGYDQQDSHEFLSFFIDAIHEDLNEVVVKPYQEIPDYKENEDIKEYLNKCYDLHKSRNRSFIIQTFHGQFYSKIKCPNKDCNLESISGDPFDILSLAPPNYTKTKFEFYYYPSSYEQTINKFALLCLEENNTTEVLTHFKNEFQMYKHKRIQAIYYEKLRYIRDVLPDAPMPTHVVTSSDGLVIYCETFDAEISRMIFGERIADIMTRPYEQTHKIRLQINLNQKFEGIERIIEVPPDTTHFETQMLIYMIHRAIYQETGLLPNTVMNYPVTREQIEKEMKAFFPTSTNFQKRKLSKNRI